jgi:phosphatidylserine/phosphatidylglycerophosphate/cardiolipin synthase-like enzyme
MSTSKKPTKKTKAGKNKPAKKTTATKRKPAKKITAKKKPAKKTPPVKKPAHKVIPPTPTPVNPSAPTNKTAPDFIVTGKNPKALFTLKMYRGEGMTLLAMNWINGTPPQDFVGFAIEYQEPSGTKFFALNNRLSFLNNQGNVNPNIISTRLSPIQKFRWVHFPRNANLDGLFTYRVTPVFMDKTDKLSYGEFHEVKIRLHSETYPGELNVAFTRGFVASQSFTERFQVNGDVSMLLPDVAKNGLTFIPTHPDKEAAYEWMGFEARRVILDLLDKAIADSTAEVRVTAYDLNEPELVSRLVQLGSRLKIIIDDSKDHGDDDSGETQAAAQLTASAGVDNVQRQHAGTLQHNKTIAISGTVQAAVCGSTNFSWRGFFVQNNNAILLHGQATVKLFFDAFKNLFDNKNSASGFGGTSSAKLVNLGLPSVDVQLAFSPHIAKNAMLKKIGDDMNTATSSLLYSLAFLGITPGAIRNGIKALRENPDRFVTGLADTKVGDLSLQLPNGNEPIVFPAALLQNVPEPFKSEVTGGSGVRMHHKFLVIDFDKPNLARVYMGSYNFSSAADLQNGENLLLIKDQRVAVSYMIEAITMCDHYEFRDLQAKAATAQTKLFLKTPPKNPGEVPWWSASFTDPGRIRDRLLFAQA